MILATGPCGRLGLPASGYLYGTYENPTNAGDGYSMAYPRRRRTVGNRVLPDQPADQGLQRSGVRLRREPVRRLPGQRARRAVRRLRLLVGADDGRGQERDRIRPRPDLSEGQPPARRDADARSRTSCTPPNGPPGAPSTPTAATTTAPTTSRCTSPKSGCAADIPRPGCGWTSTPAPPCPGCTRRATWRACRTTT